MEHILTPKVENVKLLDKFNAKNSPTGTLYLTTTHLIFVSSDRLEKSSDQSHSSGGNVPKCAEGKKELWILHTLIHTLDKPLLTTSGTQLRILCSHFQTATFIIQRDRDAHEVYLSLQALSRPKDVHNLYCFSYNPKGELRQSTGWNFHDLLAEFQRQGVPNENWSHCTLNEDYSLCATYPKHLFVPCLASQAIVVGSARFRSKGRLPVLTYLHKNNAAIIRCAQPLVGLSGIRSSYDEKYVDCLRQATPGAPFIHVIDTRPAINAFANRAGGKGYENDKYYENIKFSFQGIENIHTMRSSLKMLMTSLAMSTSMDAFTTELANSGWLKHVKAVLDSSVAIVKCILEGRSVIVHCSDGWDRTAQACALACLMLDGYYRTMQGFQALIEKDWLAFGHKFTDRCHLIDGDPNEMSPVFTQFLDATWQLMHTYPQAFQFNERYLITIHEHAYSSQFGTFVGNCQREREKLQLKDKTFSLWGYLVANHDDFINPLYNASTSPDCLRAKTVPQNIRFWTGLYCRFETGALPREAAIDLLATMQSQTTSLEDHGRQLSKTIGQMTQMIANAKATSTVKRMLPTAIQPSSNTGVETSFGGMATSHLEPKFEDMERKFTDLKTSLVEKCQSRLMSFVMLESLPILQHKVTPRPTESLPAVATQAPVTIPPKEMLSEAEDCVSRARVWSILTSVAIDWQPLRQCSICPCGFSLANSTKTHCHRCGRIFCKRCSVHKVELPGHWTPIAVPVCIKCKKYVKLEICSDNAN